MAWMRSRAYVSSNTMTLMMPRRPALTTAGTSLLLAILVGCGIDADREVARADSTSVRPSRPSRPLAAVDSQRVALSVKGMFCESCERTVAAMLRSTPGVLRADVSVARSEAVVVYDSTRTSPASLIGVIGTLGYKASLNGS